MRAYIAWIPLLVAVLRKRFLLRDAIEVEWNGKNHGTNISCLISYGNGIFQATFWHNMKTQSNEYEVPQDRLLLWLQILFVRNTFVPLHCLF